MTYIIPQETTPATPAKHDYAKIIAELEERDAKRRSQGLEVIAFNKSHIFPHLADAGITLVTLQYDGSGDNGCTDEVCAYIDCISAELPASIVEIKYQKWNGDIITEALSLRNAIETMCMDIAETYHQGWENGSGAYGEFHLDIISGSIRLEHNQRHESYDSSSYEW